RDPGRRRSAAGRGCTRDRCGGGWPHAHLAREASADIHWRRRGLHGQWGVRTGLKKGATGLQTVYDVFGVCPLGFGIVDPTAGGALVTAYLSGKDLKSLLEFFLADDPTLPGQYFPRVSGMRVRYDTSRPKYDQVTEIQRGDLESGYR